LHFTADRPEGLRQASDAFSAACHLIEGNPWYHLNLSYAYAGMGEWIEAAEAIEQLLQCEPEWFRSPVLQSRLAEYRLRRGDELVAEKSWEAAMDAYRSIRVSPDTAVPADLAAASAKRLGDTLVQLGRLEEAGREYRAALTTAFSQLDLEDQAALQARLAFLAGFRGEFLTAADLLGEALVMRGTLDDPRPVDVVVADATAVIQSTEQYRRVSEILRLVPDRLELTADERWGLARARLELAEARGRMLLHPAGTGSTEGVDPPAQVIPLMLEAQSSLFPQLGETPEVVRMLERDLPEMRDRIWESSGVRVPGVRIRASDERGPGHYLIMVNEVPLASGIVRTGELFSPDLDDCRRLGIVGSPPVCGDLGSSTGAEVAPDGLWLPLPEDQQRARAAGLSLWDPYHFMVRHLEAVVWTRLPFFLGLEETSWLIEEWAADGPERSRVLASAIPDELALARFVHALQALVREGVALGDLGVLLSAFAEGPADGQPEQAVERLRRALERVAK
jgi:tetratricopeptide (TPR) repeat protein